MVKEIKSAKEALIVYSTAVLEKYTKIMVLLRPYIVKKAAQLAQDLEILGVLGIGPYWQHSRPADLDQYNSILKEIRAKEIFDREEVRSYYRKLNEIFPIANDCDLYLVLKKYDDKTRRTFTNKINKYIHGLEGSLGVKVGDNFIDLRAEDVISLEKLCKAKKEYKPGIYSTGPGDAYRRDVIVGNAIGLYIANPKIAAQRFDPEPWEDFLKVLKSFSN